MRLIQEKLPIAQRSFGILVDRQRDRLNMKVAITL
jgi:hypothetical protein